MNSTLPVAVQIEQNNAALVFDPIIIDPAALPFRLAEGAVIDKAAPEEIAAIRLRLPQLVGGYFSPYQFFEFDNRIEASEGAVRMLSTPLDEKDWRYYVVRTSDNGSMAIDLDLISELTDARLDLGAFQIKASGYGYKMITLINRYHYGGLYETKHVGLAELREISDLYQLKISVAGPLGTEGPYPEIGRALDMLSSLGSLMPSSVFHVLGLFAIIEMLVTHNPKLEDRGDSITHQMKAKIPLLSRRFDRPLPYSSHFGEASSDKIWSALYAYRSAVAHGGKVDFGKSPAVLLKNKENADAFLLTTVQSLIRHALREPDLYRDLREC